jgi:hypothetical protein
MVILVFGQVTITVLDRIIYLTEINKKIPELPEKNKKKKDDDKKALLKLKPQKKKSSCLSCFSCFKSPQQIHRKRHSLRRRSSS